MLGLCRFGLLANDAERRGEVERGKVLGSEEYLLSICLMVLNR